MSMTIANVTISKCIYIILCISMIQWDYHNAQEHHAKILYHGTIPLVPLLNNIEQA